MSIPVLSKQSAPRTASDSAPCTSEGNKSMLARFKQQAQETGVFLKKQQQAISQQMQKGIKMATSVKPGQKKENASHDIQVPHATITAESGKSDDKIYDSKQENIGFNEMGEWFSTLTQMGFEKPHIYEAARIVGGVPEHLDDLLQVVVAIAASEERESCGGASSSLMPAASSSMTEEKPPESEPLLASSAHEPSEDPPIPLDLQPPLPPPLSPPPPCASACGSTRFETCDEKARILQSATPKLDTRIFEGLQEMGFESESIYAAFEVLGVEASMDDFFDLLLRMPDNSQVSIQTQLDASAGSAEVLYEVSGFESEEDVRSLSGLDLAPIESSAKDLAAAIVAAAIEKASLRELSTPIVPKKITEYPSPMRGGA
jgi:hypothetical protein